MGGGGSDTTTNVTNTGLGDDQYQALADNQVGISGQITGASSDANKRYDTFDNRFNTLDTSFTGVGDNITSGFTNIQDLLSTYNTGMNTQFDTVNTNVGSNATALAGNNQAIGNLQTGVTDGFSDMSGRFDNVDASNVNLQGSVDQGFIDQTQGFVDAQADRTAQFQNANSAMNQGFSDTGAALQTGFADTTSQLATTQANVLGGQGDIQNNLGTLSDNADIYAQQSLENQAAIQTDQDGFRSSFDNYADRYGDDQELAQESRADLATAQANQTDRLREDMGNFANVASVGQRGISNQIKDVSAKTEGGFVDQSNALRSSTDALMESLDSRQIIAARDMARQASFLPDVGEESRIMFNQLGSSFDDNGKLIRSSIDANGNSLSRQMDEAGNLILNSFDVSGNQIGNNVINIQSSLEQLNAMQAGAA